MNTMADGAAQRLVAQIGDTLFGQPGLNLMELAEKVKGIRVQHPAIPEGWALVNLAEYTVLPQIPTTAMMDAGWPIGEQITDQFDVKGAYADLIAEHEAKGEEIIHGPVHQTAQAVDLVDFKALYRAYVRLLESGRDRIRDLGGSCDPVDVMEANDIDLRAARRVMESQAVGK